MGIYRGRVSDWLFLPVDISRPQWVPGDPGRPRRVLVALVLDTGSRYCTLRPELVRSLSLPFVRSVTVRTHVAEGTATLHQTNLSFPLGSLTPLEDVLVAALEMPVDLAAYDGVIGRRVLQKWQIFYDGPRQRLTIRDHRNLWGWLVS